MTYDARNDSQHGPFAYVNPGEGGIEGSELMHAAIAVEQLAIDAFGFDDASTIWSWERAPDLDEGGRFGFELRGGASDWLIRIAMPGLPLEQVRYLGSDDQNIWHFPRIFLYHPDSPTWPDSWVWCYMIDALRERAIP